MRNKNILKTTYFLGASLCCLGLLTACSSENPSKPSAATPPSVSSSQTPDVPNPSNEVKGSRDNTPNCLVPEAPGTVVSENDLASIDYSNCNEGYVCVKYTGSVSKIKLRITGPDEVVYTYDLKTNDYETFPLTAGNGSYNISIYENVDGSNYVTAHFDVIDVNIEDELKAYLYPNQYVNFNSNSKVVKLGSELVFSANDDLEAVTAIYDYLINNITYNYEFAETSPTGYVSNVDSILESGTGICLDYAAVMCSMLRSQGIPTRLEVGYAADAYHAWISVYLKETGWVNGVIEFTGSSWTLVDPTFGASSDEKALKKFIGDGSNYTLQKIY